MKLRIAALLTLLCLPMASHAQVVTGDGSTTLTGTTVKQIFLATTLNSNTTLSVPRRYWRICNVNASSGATAWLSHTSTTPAPNAAGSYALAPGSCEEFAAPSFVPQGGLYAVADGTGTVQLTAEAY